MGFVDRMDELSGRTKRVQTVTVKGDKAAARMIEQMAARGWELQSAASRRQVASMHSGASLLFPPALLMTGKQKHTMTFVKTGS